MKCPKCGLEMTTSINGWLCLHCGHSEPKAAGATNSSVMAVPVVAAAGVVTPPVQPEASQSTRAMPPVVPSPVNASPETYTPNAITQSTVNSVGITTIRTGSRSRGWGLVLILTIFVLVFGVFSFLMIQSSNHAKLLLKTGKQTQAIVTHVHVNVNQTNTSSSGNTNAQVSYNTDVSYQMPDVSGYSSQTYNSNLSGDQTNTIQDGQRISAIYNPSNPGDNGLQMDLQQQASPLAQAMPYVFGGFFLIVIIAIVLTARRNHLRNRAIRDLQA